MDHQKLVQFFLLGTLINTASAWFTSTRVYDILPASEFPPDTIYSIISPQIGEPDGVSAEECKAASNFIGRGATTWNPVTPPRTYGVKYQPTYEYVIMALANCGGGVYVKVLGNGNFHIYFTRRR